MLTKTDILTIKQLIKDEISEGISPLKKEISTMKEDIIQFKDEILKEIVDLRDYIAVTTGYRDMIEDHDIRIAKLEKRHITN